MASAQQAHQWYGLNDAATTAAYRAELKGQATHALGREPGQTHACTPATEDGQWSLLR
jgi:hypothetical protein